MNTLQMLMPDLVPTAPLSIQVEVRNVYGEQKVYPICEKAKLFAEIAGTKTLTHCALTQIEQLGYLIQAQAPAVSVGKLKSPSFR